ncbi:hypothetical protein [Parahaliea mediterranea]|uniref:hypothetical protein n=1 Tax=Parahaliea mediterranea TaxID=651086 RepID=UPI000E2F38A1|nr:hypothetical protein [Parahaliea mediterranea]
MTFSLFGSDDQIEALYEGFSDEGKAEFDRIVAASAADEANAKTVDDFVRLLEAEWQKSEVGNENHQAPLSHNNTWPHVRCIRNEIAEDYGTHLSELDAAWKKLSADYGEFLSRERDEAFGSTPLEAFLMLIRQGYYPPPEILLAVADSFDAYFLSHGDVEMDKFFKERIRGYGDFATRRAAEHDSREFLILKFINKYRAKNRKKNVPDLEDEYLRMKGRSTEEAGSIDERARRLRAREKPKN